MLIKLSRYMAKSLDRNAERSQYIKKDDSSFESVDEFKYVAQPKQIKILYKMKLRVYGSQRMLFIFCRCRIFCLPIRYSELRNTEL